MRFAGKESKSNKMKQQITITMDEEKIKILDEILKERKFRNKSHVLEYSFEKFIESELNKGEKLQNGL